MLSKPFPVKLKSLFQRNRAELFLNKKGCVAGLPLDFDVVCLVVEINSPKGAAVVKGNSGYFPFEFSKFVYYVYQTRNFVCDYWNGSLYLHTHIISYKVDSVKLC